MRHRTALSLAALALLLAPPLGAQGRPQTREGFTISFGFGGGSAGFECTGCPSDRETGTTFFLNIGGTVSPRMTVGGEINGWGKVTDAESDVVSSLMAVIHFYPQARQGFFLIGGAGFTSMALDNEPNNILVESTGFGVQVGAGYDWRVARNFSLTPHVAFVQSFASEAELNGVGFDEDPNPNYFQLGLGFTWH